MPWRIVRPTSDCIRISNALILLEPLGSQGLFVTEAQHSLSCLRHILITAKTDPQFYFLSTLFLERGYWQIMLLGTWVMPKVGNPAKWKR